MKLNSTRSRGSKKEKNFGADGKLVKRIHPSGQFHILKVADRPRRELAASSFHQEAAGGHS